MAVFPSTMTIEGNYRITAIVPYKGEDVAVCTSIADPATKTIPLAIKEFHKADLQPSIGQEYFVAVLFNVKEHQREPGGNAINITMTYNRLVSISTNPGEPAFILNKEAA